MTAKPLRIDRTGTTELYSEDAETAVLSAILMESHALRVVRPFLAAGDFYSARNASIYTSQLAVADRGDPIDPFTLAEELNRRGELDAAGGKDYIGFLVDAVPTAANCEFHARIVLDRAQRRALQTHADTASRAASDPTIDTATVARAHRDQLDAFLAIVDGGALPPAIRASDAPPAAPLLWTIAELWPAGEIGLTVGDGGSFKSTAAIHMAGAIAGGYSVFGHFATMRAPTMIVSAEDSADVVLMRLRAFVVGHGWSPRVLDDVHVLANPDATLADARWRNHITREALRIGAGFVVLDPLAELIAGDENSNSDVRATVKYLRHLSRETKACVNIVHHAGKAGQDKRPLDRIRGASALASAARTILFFEYQETGVLVTHLKNSRGPKLEPFELTRWIDSDAANRADWTSARLSHAVARVAALSRGEEFVLAQVTASPRCLTSTDLRGLSGASGIRREDVAKAISALEKNGRISWQPGSTANSKLWFPSLPTSLGRLEEISLPTLPEACPGRRIDSPANLPTPLRGAGWVEPLESE